MKRTKAQWRELRVINSHDLMRLTPGKAWIAYRQQDRGRISQSAAWQVVAMRGESDPGNHWADCGHKTFRIWRPSDPKEKDAALQEAMKFAKKAYGIKEWERGPFGDWYPAGSMKLAEAGMKKANERGGR